MLDCTERLTEQASTAVTMSTIVCMTGPVHHDPRTQFQMHQDEYRIDRIDLRKKTKIENAPCGPIKPIVPGFI